MAISPLRYQERKIIMDKVIAEKQALLDKAVLSGLQVIAFLKHIKIIYETVKIQ